MLLTFKIQPILVYNYVVWWKPVTWLYGLIRWWTKSNWNHCVIEVTSIINGETISEIYDSNFRGAISRPYSVWRTSNKRKCAYINIPTHKTELELLFDLKSHQGKLYQYGVYLTRLFGKRTDSTDTLYCFELLEKIYGINKPTDGKDYEKYITVQFSTHFRTI